MYKTRKIADSTSQPKVLLLYDSTVQEKCKTLWPRILLMISQFRLSNF
jgi:hypothetical protein